MTSYFELYSNKLCSEVPVQVQALSSGVTVGWKVTTGNEPPGIPCTWPKLPTVLPSLTSTIDYTGASLTGSIPTELCRLSSLTQMWLGQNSLSGKRLNTRWDAW